MPCQDENFDRPTLIVPLLGTKRLDFAGGSAVARPGSVLCVPGGLNLTVTNVPQPGTGRYEALCIGLIGQTLGGPGTSAALAGLPRRPCVPPAHPGLRPPKPRVVGSNPAAPTSRTCSPARDPLRAPVRTR